MHDNHVMRDVKILIVQLIFIHTSIAVAIIVGFDIVHYYWVTPTVTLTGITPDDSAGIKVVLKGCEDSLYPEVVLLLRAHFSPITHSTIRSVCIMKCTAKVRSIATYSK